MSPLICKALYQSLSQYTHDGYLFTPICNLLLSPEYISKVYTKKYRSKIYIPLLTIETVLSKKRLLLEGCNLWVCISLINQLLLKAVDFFNSLTIKSKHLIDVLIFINWAYLILLSHPARVMSCPNKMPLFCEIHNTMKTCIDEQTSSSSLNIID